MDRQCWAGFKRFGHEKMEKSDPRESNGWHNIIEAPFLHGLKSQARRRRRRCCITWTVLRMQPHHRLFVDVKHSHWQNKIFWSSDGSSCLRTAKWSYKDVFLTRMLRNVFSSKFKESDVTSLPLFSKYNYYIYCFIFQSNNFILMLNFIIYVQS